MYKCFQENMLLENVILLFLAQVNDLVRRYIKIRALECVASHHNRIILLLILSIQIYDLVIFHPKKYIFAFVLVVLLCFI